jgi:hypothetical protein
MDKLWYEGQNYPPVFVHKARTILLFHIISARPSKQPRMVRSFLKVYMELGSYFLFLQEQVKDIIICVMSRLVHTVLSS